MERRPIGTDDIECHTRWLRALAGALVRGEDRADDLVQETWLRHASASGGVAPERGRLAGILRGLSRNAWRAETRRVRRERAVARDEAAPGSDELAARLELSERLVREVSELPEEQRTAVLLRYFDGLSSAEIARRLDVPGATVRSRLKRGLDELRRRLEDDDEGRGATLLALVPWAGVPEASKLATATGGTLMTTMQMKWISLAIVLGFVGVGGWAWRGTGPGSPPVRIAPRALSSELAEPSVVAVEPSSRARRGPTSATVDPASVANATDGPYRARLVDAVTGEPVPHYLVSLRDESGEGELLESGPDGTIESSGAWPAGSLDLFAFDLPPGLLSHELQAIEVDHDPDAAPADVEVRVGPTYRLAVSLPGGLAASDLQAELVPEKRGNFLMARRTVVRAGAQPWVRFPPAALHAPGSGPWSLELRSDDGFWFGSASVEREAGIQPGLVPLTLEHRARLAVHLTRDGEPLGTTELPNARLLLSGPSERTARYHAGVVLGHLVPGEHQLRFEDPSFHPAVAPLDLVAGETREVVLDLDPRDGLAPLSGVLRSAGDPLQVTYVALVLESAEPGDPLMLHLDPQVPWTEVPFRFEDVPAGAYTLRAHAPGFDANPDPIQVEAGQEGIVVQFGVESLERIPFEVEVLAATSHEPVLYASVTRWDERGWSSSTASTRNRLELVGRVGGDEEWMIRAVGYQPWWGTQADLDPDAATVVELAPGWGAVVRARDEAKEPLGGIAIYLDGTVAGKTGPDGRLRVLFHERPERITVDTETWELVPGGVVDADGKFEDRENGITLTLRPASE